MTMESTSPARTRSTTVTPLPLRRMPPGTRFAFLRRVEESERQERATSLTVAPSSLCGTVTASRFSCIALPASYRTRALRAAISSALGGFTPSSAYGMPSAFHLCTPSV